ncbi:MAG: 4Fe-4S dicluster domain-containing protein [Desulfovibrionaceae bacterium]|nr:4Fe-4S dicluster domain-containing protein [Desulfovibrionaceae bacterium]
MLRIIKERLHQKHRTLDWPARQPALSPRYMGRPVLTNTDCADCRACLTACPTGALLREREGRTPTLDMGRCLFCGACRNACPKGAIQFSQDYRLAAFKREDLLIRPDAPASPLPQPPKDYSLFRRSLKLRHVSAGGCNACEADTNVLGTLVFDLGRFGIEYAASPRHADGLIVSGPIPENMRLALLDSWAAAPEPRVLIAVGACAISGGIFAPSPVCHGALDALNDRADNPLPVDVFVPGCPPNPWTILDALLSLRRR